MTQHAGPHVVDSCCHLSKHSCCHLSKHYQNTPIETHLSKHYRNTQLPQPRTFRVVCLAYHIIGSTCFNCGVFCMMLWCFLYDASRRATRCHGGKRSAASTLDVLCLLCLAYHFTCFTWFTCGIPCVPQRDGPHAFTYEMASRRLDGVMPLDHDTPSVVCLCLCLCLCLWLWLCL